MSLLQDVLKQQLEAVEDAQRRSGQQSEDSDDEMIDVMSGAATPVRSRNPTRSGSPSRANRAQKPSTLAHSSLSTELTTRINTNDPLRALPDKIRPIIFCMLSPTDLASCVLVCHRWKNSQTLNHAWYQIHRHETYQFSDLPIGKWTKRESKRDWRTELFKARKIRDRESSTPLNGLTFSNSRSRTPARSGASTPKEQKEEEWARQEQTSTTPDKVQSRAWYKEVGGKRVRKTKAGMTGGMRDRTAWEED